MSGEDFTVELRVYASSGWTKDEVLRTLEAIFEQSEDNGSVYLYPRESKIMRQSILEVTGVKRDFVPRPIISSDLLLKLEYYLARDAALAAEHEERVFHAECMVAHKLSEPCPPTP